MARPTGDNYVDSILYGDNHWGSDNLTYYFDNGYDAWEPGAKSAFRDALKSWSDVADIDFRETYLSGNADLVEYYLDDADMTNLIGSGVLGAHDIPFSNNHSSMREGFHNWESFGWPGPNGYDADSLKPGGLAMSTFIHELGHALGLAHPHDSYGPSVQMPGVSSDDDLGTYELNQGVFTVMSYNDGWIEQDPWYSGVNDKGYNSGPGALDIAAIQYLYGADTSNNGSGTTYNLSGSMGWSAIWDTGGSDQIRYTGNQDAVINLNSAPLDEGKNAGGYLSYLKGGDNYGGYTIAGDATNALANKNGETGVIIENATGGSGDDKIIGNKVANLLKGNDGADDLRGRAGDDKIVGGSGKDQLTAGTGDDVVLGGDGSDVLRGEKGADTLGGGDGNDRLYGSGGGDVLKGAAGNDRLRGGSGADDFVFRAGYDNDSVQDFKRGIDTLVLDDNLWSGVMTAQDVVDTFGTRDGNSTVLDFGGGDTLTVVGISNPDNLVSDISIV